VLGPEGVAAREPPEGVRVAHPGDRLAILVPRILELAWIGVKNGVNSRVKWRVNYLS